MLILLQLFSISLKVLDHQILSRELVVIRKVIDDLMITKSDS